MRRGASGYHSVLSGDMLDGERKAGEEFSQRGLEIGYWMRDGDFEVLMVGEESRVDGGYLRE